MNMKKQKTNQLEFYISEIVLSIKEHDNIKVIFPKGIKLPDKIKQIEIPLLS